MNGLSACATPRVNRPTIAVIVPNRNDSRYLPRCITSVLGQEVQADEIIVVDDQSTDDSVSIIRSLIRDEPSAQLIENRVHLGTNGALNEGLRRSHSDYVLFLSSNDFVLPGIFDRAKSCLTCEQPPGLWSAMVWMVDEEDRLIRLHSSPVVSLHDAWFSPKQCLELAHRLGNWFTGTTLIFHRETLYRMGGLDPAYGGLSDLLTALTVACRRGAAYTPEPFGVMRVHSGGLLSATLVNVTGVEMIIERIREQGPQLESSLFTPVFLRRLAHRFRFAAIRVSAGGTIPEFSEKYPVFRSNALKLIVRCFPSGLATLRIALAFLILRPFDVIPTLWYRFAGATVVRLRARLRGNSFIGTPITSVNEAGKDAQ